MGEPLKSKRPELPFLPLKARAVRSRFGNVRDLLAAPAQRFKACSNPDS